MNQPNLSRRASRMPASPIRILSWNVNGLRACAKKGFGDWLEGSGAEIVGLQEVRAEPDQIPTELSQPEQERGLAVRLHGLGW